MKKFFLFIFTFVFTLTSVLFLPFSVKAETLTPDWKKPFWGYFDDLVSTGMNLPTLLKYVGGVLLNDSDSVKAISLFDDYLVDNSSRFGVDYQTYEEFVDSVLNVGNGVVSITPKGQEIVKEFTKYFVDTNLPYFYVPTSVVNSRFAFGFSSNENYDNFKEFVNSKGGIAFVITSGNISQSNTSSSFFRNNYVAFFDPYNEQYAVGSFLNPTRIGSIVNSSESNDFDFLYRGSLSIYDSDFNVATLTYFTSNDEFITSNENTSTSLNLYFPFINNSGNSVVEILNGFNTSNYPKYNFNDYNVLLPISFDRQKVFRVYNSLDDLRDEIYVAPSYYTTPEYYVPIASNNDVNVTVLNENIYNFTPSYNEVHDYSQTYYQNNGEYPSANVTYEYITNYYYAGSDNSTSGGDNGGSGGGGIFDFLGDLGSVLGSLISGLGNLVTNLLSALVGVFDNIANVIPDSMNTFFSTFFSWLPPEWISLITLSITLSVVWGLIKMIRG